MKKQRWIIPFYYFHGDGDSGEPQMLVTEATTLRAAFRNTFRELNGISNGDTPISMEQIPTPLRPLLSKSWVNDEEPPYWVVGEPIELAKLSTCKSQ